MSNHSVAVDGNEIRKQVIHQSRRAHVGHIGSSLSIVDILSALYSHVLRGAGTNDPGRDRFVLSKGHAALALYVTLYLKGLITRQQLETYCGDDSDFGVHPESHVPGIDFSTGSLGQGLSMAAGAALAARMQQSDRRVYALISDAELNEGSIWEAAMFTAHHRLNNLVAIVDWNGQQAMGNSRDIINNDLMLERWTSFGWDAVEVDGHNQEQLRDSLLLRTSEKPRLVLARTTFGKGVSYMEGKLKWHYWPMSDVEYKDALQELGEEI